MQVGAVAEAVTARTRAGDSPQAEIMVPLVGAVEELLIERAEAERVLDEVPHGVGRLIRIAGRAARPGLTLGVCRQHEGDPESIRFFHAAGWTTSPAHHSGFRWP